MRNIILMGLIMVVIIGAAFFLRPFEVVIPRVTEALTPMICPDGGTVATREEPGPRGGVYITYLCIGDDGSTQVSSFSSAIVMIASLCLISLVPLLVLSVYLWITVRRNRLGNTIAS